MGRKESERNCNVESRSQKKKKRQRVERTRGKMKILSVRDKKREKPHEQQMTANGSPFPTQVT